MRTYIYPGADLWLDCRADAQMMLRALLLVIAASSATAFKAKQGVAQPVLKLRGGVTPGDVRQPVSILLVVSPVEDFQRSREPGC